jgi:hypothetical protein
VVTVVAVAVVLLGWWYFSGRRRGEREALEALSSSPNVRYGSYAPAWLRNWLGDERLDAFLYVEHLCAGPMDNTDRLALCRLRELRNLVSLDLASAHVVRAPGPAFAEPLQSEPVLRRDRPPWGTPTDFDGRLTDHPQPLPLGDNELETLAGLGALTQLDLTNSLFSSRGAAAIGRLPRLQRLSLLCTLLTDAGLREIGGLHDLRWLSLDGTKITGAGLAHLEGLPTLDALRLGGSQGVRAGFANLGRLKSLTRLDVSACRLADADMAIVGELAGVRWLDISGNAITGEGLRRLAPLKGLQFLDASFTRLDDRALRWLPEAPDLEFLVLSGNDMTAAGLAELARFPRLVGLSLKFCVGLDDRAEAGVLALSSTLKYLQLTDTAVSSAAKARLIAERPGLCLDRNLTVPEEPFGSWDGLVPPSPTEILEFQGEKP